MNVHPSLNPQIRQFLSDLDAAGGKITITDEEDWRDRYELWVLEQAQDAGLVTFSVSGGEWGIDSTFTLTRAGRRALGLPRILLWFRVFILRLRMKAAGLS